VVDAKKEVVATRNLRTLHESWSRRPFIAARSAAVAGSRSMPLRFLPRRPCRYLSPSHRPRPSAHA